MNKNLLQENIREAIKSIRSHVLRAALTILIVAIGIMALVGILTALESVKGSIREDFARMGSNTFTINNTQSVKMSKRGHERIDYKSINYEEVRLFKSRYHFPAVVSVSSNASFGSTLKYENKKTNPNIGVDGIDENYLITAGYELESGRNFTPQETQSGSYSLILGSEVATTLFGNSPAVGKIVVMDAARYKVIGVLKSKGSSMGFGGDRRVFINLTHLRQKYYHPGLSLNIHCLANDAFMLNQAVDEATGIFRVIRKLKPGEDNNFSISHSDSIAEEMISNLGFLSIVAAIISFITLMGASIGLMNIMLVSVSERTREIGLRKALGANNIAIRNQFLVESVVITELGGLLGIILGISLGNMVAIFTEGPFVIPWQWILFALFVSLVVGLLSGLFPAIKAAKLDPIESLRFE